MVLEYCSHYWCRQWRGRARAARCPPRWLRLLSRPRSSVLEKWSSLPASSPNLPRFRARIIPRTKSSSGTLILEKVYFIKIFFFCDKIFDKRWVCMISSSDNNIKHGRLHEKNVNVTLIFSLIEIVLLCSYVPFLLCMLIRVCLSHSLNWI